MRERSREIEDKQASPTSENLGKQEYFIWGEEGKRQKLLIEEKGEREERVRQRLKKIQSGEKQLQKRGWGKQEYYIWGGSRETER